MAQTHAPAQAANDNMPLGYNCHLRLVDDGERGAEPNHSRSPALILLIVGTPRVLVSQRGDLTGNGQLFTQSLTARLQPLHMLSTKGSDKALDLLYTYNELGKVTAITNGAMTGDDRTYNYDDLGRLKSATGAWGSSSYKYDALGNILEKQVGARTIAMTYNLTNRLISHVDKDANGDDISGTSRLLKYDMHGNVKTLGAQRFKYDMADQPRQLLGAVTGNYTYDGNLKRVKSVVTKDGVTKTIYNVYDASGTLVHVDETTDGKYTDYIGKIAKVTNGGWTTWLHMDHLGSAQTGTDMFGMVSWREQYTPYGTTLTNPLSNNDQAGFTGHIKDSATGLNYMQARYYDPLIGRFLSIDPVGFNVGSPQMFNRFSYTSNDPVNKIDPDGNDDIFVGGQGDTVFGVVKNYRKSYASKRKGRTTSYRAFNNLGGMVTDLKAAAKSGGQVNLVCHSRGCAFAMAAIKKSGVKVDNLVTVDPVNAGHRMMPVFDGERPENIANWTNIEGTPAEGDHNFSDRVEGVGEAISEAFNTSGANRQISTTENHGNFGRMFTASSNSGENRLDNSYKKTGSNLRRRKED